ncbi:DUF6221 family protein [Kitasatospora sp. NBC_01287]|uniref:DUF6221 family protein n=1 Tax=Kitasatospora sp. NBC_01287 TaxID=2903573 RepID=UPI00224E503E|nr:DUF6221 family protein [Kitasatospora sp. NBC_01287]MCX4751759.1 DUF6221 family protein [Kitasatospora sp. NBC_01287]MCX4751949.1 DUF6221 family protein [Kitasatospora sp. NBC_01287]
MAEGSAVEFLRQAHVRAEELARAATRGPWTVHSHDWTSSFAASIGHHFEADVVGGGHEGGGVVDLADAEFIVANDPAAVLRRVAAERQILAEHQPTRDDWDSRLYEPCELAGCRCSSREDDEYVLACGSCATGNPYDAVLQHWPVPDGAAARPGLGLGGGSIVTTFYLKRPGQYSDEAEAIVCGDDDSWPGSTHAAEDEWALSLPHSCDAWEIGIGSLGDVLEAAREFRAGLDEAIRRLEQEQAEDGNEPARYAAARAGAARSLREMEEEAAELGLGSLAGLAGWQAEQFEGWTPFTALPDSAFRLARRPPEIPAACYAASWGWVHVRPGCRCPRTRR